MESAVIVSICQSPGDPPFAARWHADGDEERCLVELTGTMCTRTIDQAAEPLVRWVRRSIVPLILVDMTAVDFIDGRGISTLVHLHRTGNDELRSLRLEPVSQCVERLMRTCGLGALVGPVP